MSQEVDSRPPVQTWLSAKRAYLDCGLSFSCLHRACTLGLIRTLIQPGSYIKYALDDIENLPSEFISSGRGPYRRAKGK